MTREPFLFFRMISIFAILTSGANAAQTDDCKAVGNWAFKIENETPVATAPSRLIPESSTHPAHCSVSGFVAPQVGFEVRLPTDSWNGRFLQQGCRGMCGFIPSDTTNDALSRGYAVATTDMGHKATNSQSGIWAINNMQGKIDFGHRATHVTAIAAQELISRFYGAKPKAKYFRGCGTGGRQALVEAQRYPDDFDGIIANGGIVFDFTKLNYLMAWSVRANIDANGNQILSGADVELLHRAVLQKCDLKDGLKDDVIAYPQSCSFDPASLACGTAKAQTCLTPAKVDAARKMYAGPTQDNGIHVYPGMSLGSELRWPNAFFGANPNYAKFSVEIMRYFLYPTSKGPAFQLTDFDLNAPLSTFNETEKLVSADSTNFSTFRARGGKLLVMHGWNESAMPGSYPIQFYDKLVKQLGSIKAAREFFRFYMIPGEMHCTSGIPEGRHFDSLTMMERWVEDGVPMDIIAGYEVSEEPKLPNQVRFPIDPSAIKSERPFALYPDTLTYKGRGDPVNLSSYRRHKY